MCMALAALFSIVVAANMAYKMMVKHEPLDVMKLFKPLVISIILCWWYPPADTGMTNSGSNWCVLDFLSYIPNSIGSYTHDLYEAEATQIAHVMTHYNIPRTSVSLFKAMIHYDTRGYNTPIVDIHVALSFGSGFKFARFEDSKITFHKRPLPVNIPTSPIMAIRELGQN